MQYYGYDEYLHDFKALVQKVNFQFDAIVSIARGGIFLGGMLSYHFDIRAHYTINSIGYEDSKKLNIVKVFNTPDLTNYKKVLIVDDIVDSGDSLMKVLSELRALYPHVEFQTLAMFYKEGAKIKPDYFERYATKWIEFFWERDVV